MSAEVLMLNRFRNHSALWMPDPASWVWRRPDGHLQGPGLVAYTDPGYTNLLWLAMDMDTPPSGNYNLRANGLANLLMATSAATDLGGLPLRDQAASLTLHQFRQLCLAGPKDAGGIAELLAVLALNRLEHAHT